VAVMVRRPGPPGAPRPSEPSCRACALPGPPARSGHPGRVQAQAGLRLTVT
jgi:hypothetical protein